jgi:GNAT superfamily N-acetyltransferase
LIEGSARAAARRDPASGVVCLPVGGGLAVWTGPGSPFDKAVGVGFGRALEEAEIAAAERAFAERQAPLAFEVSSLADPQVFEALGRRGYVLRGFENVLALPLAAGREARVADGLRLETVEPDAFAAWMDVVVTAFATPDGQGVAAHEEFPRDALETAMRDLAAADGFTCLLARCSGAPAGGASLRVHEGVAQLCGAATLPEFRRRGVQASLLSSRLALAAAAGCDVAVVTTQPGSKSQENVQRLGFELVYARAVLVKTA